MAMKICVHILILKIDIFVYLAYVFRRLLICNYPTSKKNNKKASLNCFSEPFLFSISDLKMIFLHCIIKSALIKFFRNGFLFHVKMQYFESYIFLFITTATTNLHYRFQNSLIKKTYLRMGANSYLNLVTLITLFDYRVL